MTVPAWHPRDLEFAWIDGDAKTRKALDEIREGDTRFHQRQLPPQAEVHSQSETEVMIGRAREIGRASCRERV